MPLKNNTSVASVNHYRETIPKILGIPKGFIPYGQLTIYYGIVAIFDHNMGFCMSHHLSILLLSYLFCRIFMLILKILPRLLSFANYLGLFIVIDVLSDYVCLDQLFALLMNLLAEIVLIYTKNVEFLL